MAIAKGSAQVARNSLFPLFNMVFIDFEAFHFLGNPKDFRTSTKSLIIINEFLNHLSDSQITFVII